MKITRNETLEAAKKKPRSIRQLTDAQVEDIRSLYVDNTSVRYDELEEQFRISRSTIYKVLNFRKPYDQ